MKDRTLVQIANVENEGIDEGRREGNIHPKHIEKYEYNVNINY
jgi:hypothetical protein